MKTKCTEIDKWSFVFGDKLDTYFLLRADHYFYEQMFI